MAVVLQALSVGAAFSVKCRTLPRAASGLNDFADVGIDSGDAQAIPGRMK
jgi:hypothetical protein